MIGARDVSPVLASAVLVALLLLGGLVGSERHAVGWVVDVRRGSDGTTELLRVEAPGLARRFVAREAGEPVEGRWILAYGVSTTVAARPVLKANKVRMLPGPAYRTLEGWWHQAPSVALLQDRPTLAAGLGALIIMLGAVLVRLASAGVVGCLGAMAAWHGAVLASMHELAVVNDNIALLFAVSGFVFGAWLGQGRDCLLVWIGERLAVGAILAPLISDIAAVFDWTHDVTRATAMVATAVSPGFGGPWLVGAYVLILGLDAEGLGVVLILGVSGVAAYVMVGGDRVLHPRLTQLYARVLPRVGRSSVGP